MYSDSRKPQEIMITFSGTKPIHTSMRVQFYLVQIGNERNYFNDIIDTRYKGNYLFENILQVINQFFFLFENVFEFT